MWKKIIFVLFLLLESAQAQEPVLERYIREGLANNLALAQQQFAYETSRSALQEARGHFLPSIDIDARYTRAGGGRVIDFPVGDLMNPVYRTLNALLAAQGQSPPFPADLQNVTIPFLREREQETRVRVLQPLFQPKIVHNYRLKKSLAAVQEARKQAYARELIFNIKEAYFHFLIAGRTAEIYQQTDALLRENLRVSRKLFESQKVTADVVYRTQAELAALEQKTVEAERQQAQAARYFNFLLNRPFDAEILRDESGLVSENVRMARSELEAHALRHREEFAELGLLVEATKQTAALASAEKLPGVTLVLDYGIQGENYRLDADADFWMATVSLRWNLFNGFRSRAKRQQAQLERRRIETRLDELRQQITLQLRAAVDDLDVARRAITAAGARLRSARQSFTIVQKQFAAGMAPHVAFLDAREALTTAELSAAIARNRYRIAYARLERVAALRQVEPEEAAR